MSRRQDISFELLSMDEENLGEHIVDSGRSRHLDMIGQSSRIVDPPQNLSDKALERYFGEILDEAHEFIEVHMMKKLMNIIMKIVQMVAGVGNNNLKTKTKNMVLKKGSTGPEVEELQKILGIKVDGDFGPATKLAVMKYQAQNGLTADGIVGPKTWAQMTSKTSPDSSSKYLWILG